MKFKYSSANSSARFGLMLIMPSIILLGLVVVYPIIKMFVISVTKNNLLRISDTGFVGIENFIWVLKNNSFWNALLNTVILTVVSVLAQTVIGLILAIFLTENIKGRGVFRSAIILPWAVPTVVAATVWVWMYMPTYGIFNLFLNLLGFDTSNITWLGDTKLALFSVIITHVWKGLPIVFLVILANLQTIPTILYEAAKIDGANTWQSFRHITIPSIKSGIALIMLLRGVWTFNWFDMVWIMTAGGPVESTMTLPVMIYKVGFNSFRLDRAAAISLTMFAILMIAGVFITQNRENTKELEI